MKLNLQILIVSQLQRTNSYWDQFDAQIESSEGIGLFHRWQFTKIKGP